MAFFVFSVIRSGQRFRARRRTRRIWDNPARKLAVKTMVSSGPQVAPKPASASQIASWCTAADLATFFNFPPAENPSQRLSGEKNGAAAPSVPAIGIASNWSSLCKSDPI